MSKITSGPHGITIETDKFTLMVMSHNDGTITISGARDLSMNVSRQVFDKWVGDLAEIK